MGIGFAAGRIERPLTRPANNVSFLELGGLWWWQLWQLDWSAGLLRDGDRQKSELGSQSTGAECRFWRGCGGCRRRNANLGIDVPIRRVRHGTHLAMAWRRGMTTKTTWRRGVPRRHTQNDIYCGKKTYTSLPSAYIASLATEFVALFSSEMSIVSLGRTAPSSSSSSPKTTTDSLPPP